MTYVDSGKCSLFSEKEVFVSRKVVSVADVRQKASLAQLSLIVTSTIYEPSFPINPTIRSFDCRNKFHGTCSVIVKETGTTLIFQAVFCIIEQCFNYHLVGMGSPEL